MKRQTLMCALGLLRQRCGHKALLDGRLLREHRPLRDPSSSATQHSTSAQVPRLWSRTEKQIGQMVKRVGALCDFM